MGPSSLLGGIWEIVFGRVSQWGVIRSAVEAGLVRELQGVAGRLKADQGLLVAWGQADLEPRRQ